ncbi:unnamed protein product, partial [Rotaria sp. Silwood2]
RPDNYTSTSALETSTQPLIVTIPNKISIS